MGFGENGAVRRVAMGFTKDDEPLHGRGDSDLRRGRCPYLADTDGSTAGATTGDDPSSKRTP